MYGQFISDSNKIKFEKSRNFTDFKTPCSIRIMPSPSRNSPTFHDFSPSICGSFVVPVHTSFHSNAISHFHTLIASFCSIFNFVSMPHFIPLHSNQFHSIPYFILNIGLHVLFRSILNFVSMLHSIPFFSIPPHSVFHFEHRSPCFVPFHISSHLHIFIPIHNHFASHICHLCHLAFHSVKYRFSPCFIRNCITLFHFHLISVSIHSCFISSPYNVSTQTNVDFIYSAAFISTIPFNHQSFLVFNHFHIHFIFIEYSILPSIHLVSYFISNSDHYLVSFSL